MCTKIGQEQTNIHTAIQTHLALMTNNRTTHTFNTFNSFYRTTIKLRYLIILSLLTCKAGQILFTNLFYRDANKVQENQYKSQIEDLQRIVSTVQQDKDTLQGQLNVLEGKNKEYSQQLEDKLCVNKVDNSNQTTTSGTEQVTMAGELEKPEDILRQRIMELEKLEKHLKKQVQ